MFYKLLQFTDSQVYKLSLHQTLLGYIDHFVESP